MSGREINESAGTQRLAMVFPGQGGQTPGMGRALVAAYPQARRRLAALSSVVHVDLETLLCGDALERDPVSVHLAMVSFGILAWEWLTRDHGLRPVLLAGHSLGEITALACAGALGADDAMRLAAARGRSLAEACAQRAGGMTAFVGAPLNRMQAGIRHWIETTGCDDLWIVNLNGPRQLVVAGDAARLKALEAAMNPLGLRAVPLATAGAFHTPFMRPAAVELASFLRTIPFAPFQTPVVSSMTGRLLLHHESLATHLALQVVKPVLWLETMQFMRRAQTTRLVEAGPGKGVLASLASGVGEWKVAAQALENFTERENALPC